MSALTRKAVLFELFAKTEDQLNRLTGFQKHHRIPDKLDDYSLQWIQGLSNTEIEEKIRDTGAKIRKTLSLKRKDFVVEIEPGNGTIQVPEFQYKIELQTSEHNPAEINWLESILFRSPDLLERNEFSELFDGLFHSFKVHFEKPVEVTQVIDWFEEESFPGMDIEYDLVEQDSCIIIPEKRDYQFLITTDAVTIDFMGTQTIACIQKKIHEIGETLGFKLTQIET